MRLERQESRKMALDRATANTLGLGDITGGDAGGEDIGIPADPLKFADGASITPNADGSETIDLNPAVGKPKPEEIEHSENLANFMDETVLNGIASDIIKWVQEDRDSRADWESMLSQGLTYLGLKIEDRSFPFPNAAGVFDPILLEAVIRWHSTASAELLPAAGPVKTQIIGQPTPETESQAARVKEFLNWYLMEGAPEWVEQNDQMLFWLPLIGSTFKKTYQDPILNRVVSPFILPQDFIVSFSTDDLETCSRATHVINMSAKDMKMRQLSGFYSDVELKEPDYTTEADSALDTKSIQTQGLTKPTESDEAPFEVYECHIDLDLPGFEHTEVDEEVGETAPDSETGEGEPTTGEPTQTGLPLPYIVTVETGSQKVLSIRRNWAANDHTYAKIQYFTHFKFTPGLGFYGIGYAHILGNTAKSATSLQRQMIDAATLEMFPGGLKVKGMRGDDNNIMIGPCEFRELDTGGMPIQQAIMTMPYKGPSAVSLELWKETRENGRGLGGMTEIAVGEGRQDAPVGTTVALMEAANRVQSATIKAAHRAYRREFKLIGALFGQFLPEEPYPWPVAGGPHVIMRADFSEQIDVIPVSDPNITSSAQRMMRADAICNFAGQFPQIYDPYQANYQRLVEMGVDEKRIEKILPPKPSIQPTDPLTENQNILMSKPVAVGPDQDHDSHITSHQPLALGTVTINPGQPPDPMIQAAALSHIAEHEAAKLRIQVQNILGMQLPQPGQKLPPQVENQIAVLVAKAMQQITAPQNPQDPTPAQIALEQIKVEAQKVQAKIQESQANTSSKAFIATLKLKSDREERLSREKIALLNDDAKRVISKQKAAEQARKAAKARAFGTRSTF